MPKAKTTKKRSRPKKTKIIKEEKPKKVAKKVGRYFEAIGRRKTAVSRVRLQSQGQKEFLINDQSLEKYFPTLELQQIVKEPLEKMNCLADFRISIKVKGGGLHAQAEAVRHGITRALIKCKPEFHRRLKKTGFLTRDSRMRERKKFGLKRARRAPQWQKR